MCAVRLKPDRRALYNSAVPVKRRQAGGLHRVLGTAALFSTAYGNVGSSIYYALGLVTAYALGLTPVSFFISGIIFFFTAVTYAEATARFPEAGGSSSFTRHAFNEAVSFFAGWAQMLNYTVTIAISAIFVPHYLAKFWPGGHLDTHPNDIYGGAVVVLLLVALNIVGVKEAAGLNIFLALADLGTQALLVTIGLITVFSPHVLQANVDLGISPSWHDFVISIPVAMVAYTGIETISNMAEEAIDPPRHVPRSIMYVVLAVFAIYAFLPSVALSALPVHAASAQDVANVSKYQCTAQQGLQVGDRTSDLACRFAGDPVAGVVDHLGLPDTVTSGLAFYVAILAATILIIATNAGIIGVSRLTYSMGQHRQLPEAIRRVHPKYNTPYVAIILYSLIAILLMIPNGAVSFLGNLYAFGAMLSFTLAHASVVWMRHTMPDEDMPWRGPTSFWLGGYDVPTFAILGGIGTFVSWLVTVFLHVVRRRGPGRADLAGAGHGRLLRLPALAAPAADADGAGAARADRAGAGGGVPLDPDADLLGAGGRRDDGDRAAAGRRIECHAGGDVPDRGAAQRRDVGAAGRGGGRRGAPAARRPRRSPASTAWT